MRFIITGALAAAVFAFSAAGHTAQGAPPTSAPSQGTYSGRDVTIAWNVQKTPSSVTVQGQLKNSFYYVLDDVELRANVYDASGRQLGKEAVFYVPGQLNLDETAAFALALQLPPSAVPKRVRVLYKYREISKDQYTSTPYFYTFDIPL